MYKVVSFKICPFVQRVTGLLEAKQIRYDIEYIQLNDKPNWFLNASPHGQVPVLFTESGQPLFESEAIAEFLEESTGPTLLQGNPEQRARQRAWGYLATKHYLTQCSTLRSADEKTFLHHKAGLEKAFSRMEVALSSAPFFMGNHPGWTDIAWLPLLHRTEIIARCADYDFLDGYPGLQTWRANLLKSGLSDKSVPEDFENVFCSFYLSGETWLGRRSLSKPAGHSACEPASTCTASCC